MNMIDWNLMKQYNVYLIIWKRPCDHDKYYKLLSHGLLINSDPANFDCQIDSFSQLRNIGVLTDYWYDVYRKNSNRLVRTL